MVVQRLVILRHAARQDIADPFWIKNSATPYDPPLSQVGKAEAMSAGSKLATILQTHGIPGDTIVVHSSPFLRCVQTAMLLAKGIADCYDGTPHEYGIRLDAVFGEWIDAEYFQKTAPPPPDNHAGMVLSSTDWGNSQVRSHPYVSVDKNWLSTKFGNSGDYGESWSDMYYRVVKGLEDLVRYYESDLSALTIVLVGHGAACNALLGYLTRSPSLSKISLASFSIFNKDNDLWHLLYDCETRSEERAGNQKVPPFSGEQTLIDSPKNRGHATHIILPSDYSAFQDGISSQRAAAQKLQPLPGELEEEVNQTIAPKIALESREQNQVLQDGGASDDMAPDEHSIWLFGSNQL